MATKKRRRKPTASLLVTIGCKIDGKPRALALRRLVKGMIFDQRSPKLIKESLVTIEFGDGETLHTALHALGVWSWGSDGEP